MWETGTGEMGNIGAHQLDHARWAMGQDGVAPAVVTSIRQAHPGIRFSLEMATRDPLKVPCLTANYWATMSDVPGSELARTLRYVRANARERESLPHVSHLPVAEQIRIEEENIRQCLCYASEHLGL